MSSTILSPSEKRLDARKPIWRYSLPSPLDRWLLIVLMIVVASIYVSWSMMRYSNFLSSGYDLGIFDQAIRQYSMFRAPIVPIKGMGVNLLGDHFHPLLVVLAPLYWVWPDPRVLGIAMALLIVASAPAIYSFTRSRFSNVMSLVVTGGYLLWWPFHGIVNFDFHEVALAVPLLAWAIWSMDRGRYTLVCLLCIALLGVREDMGLVVLMISLCLAIRRRFKLAFTVGALGISAFAVVTKVLIPMLSSSGDYGYWQYSAVGATAGTALIFALSHPLQMLAHLVDAPAKISLLVALLIPTGWLAVGSVYFLLGIPLIVGRLLSDRPMTWSTNFQYNSVLAPILVLAFVDVAGRIALRFNWSASWKNVLLGSFPAAVLIGMFAFPSLYVVRPSGPETRLSDAQVETRKEALALIPPGTCVSADDRLVPHLLRTNMVAVVGRIDYLATWMILDMSQVNTGGGGDGNYQPSQALELATSTGWEMAFSKGEIRVLNRKDPNPSFCSNYVS